MLPERKLESFLHQASSQCEWDFPPGTSEQDRARLISAQKSSIIYQLIDDVRAKQGRIDNLRIQLAGMRKDRDRWRQWGKRFRKRDHRQSVPSELAFLADQLLEMNLTQLVPAAVYFLLNRGRLMYIGQSQGVAARLDQHLALRKEFDRVLYLPLPAEDLEDVEALLIRVLRPPLNGQVRREDPRQHATCRRLGLDLKALMEGNHAR